MDVQDKAEWMVTRQSTERGHAAKRECVLVTRTASDYVFNLEEHTFQPIDKNCCHFEQSDLDVPPAILQLLGPWVQGTERRQRFRLYGIKPDAGGWMARYEIRRNKRYIRAKHQLVAAYLRDRMYQHYGVISSFYNYLPDEPDVWRKVLSELPAEYLTQHEIELIIDEHLKQYSIPQASHDQHLAFAAEPTEDLAVASILGPQTGKAKAAAGHQQRQPMLLSQLHNDAAGPSTSLAAAAHAVDYNIRAPFTPLQQSEEHSPSRVSPTHAFLQASSSSGVAQHGTYSFLPATLSSTTAIPHPASLKIAAPTAASGSLCNALHNNSSNSRSKIASVEARERCMGTRGSSCSLQHSKTSLCLSQLQGQHSQLHQQQPSHPQILKNTAPAAVHPTKQLPGISDCVQLERNEDFEPGQLIALECYDRDTSNITCTVILSLVQQLGSGGYGTTWHVVQRNILYVDEGAEQLAVRAAEAALKLQHSELLQEGADAAASRRVRAGANGQHLALKLAARYDSEAKNSLCWNEEAHHQQFHLLQLRKEHKLLSKCRHPHVLHVMNCGVVSFRSGEVIAGMVAELATAGSVGDYLQQVKRFGMAAHEAQDIMWQTGQALQYCHSKWVCHRDLKPENLLGFLAPDGNIIVKLADFGCGVEVTSLGHQPATRYYTPGYEAPEILTGEPQQNGLIDSWTFGMLLLHLRTGKQPFWYRDNRITTRRDRLLQIVPGELDDEDCPYAELLQDEKKQLVQDCMEHDQNQRPTIDQIVRYHPYFAEQRQQQQQATIRHD